MHFMVNKLDLTYSMIILTCYQTYLNGLVHCFSMQIVINKCFLINPEKKIWCRFVLSFLRKMQKLHL